MSHRYYSPLRPLSLGTFPKPQGNEILHIENFEERQNVLRLYGKVGNGKTKRRAGRGKRYIPQQGSRQAQAFRLAYRWIF